jgi:hypothetical protein
MRGGRRGEARVMSSGIDRPGGPGGPSGTGSPTGPAGADDPADVVRAAGGDRAGQAVGVGGLDRAAGADPMVALAAELDAGRISPDQALARLLDEGLGADLDPAQRAELEELFSELLANDPYLAGLARDLGAAPAGGDGDASLPGGGGSGDSR